jgi:hypothetical protein
MLDVFRVRLTFDLLKLSALLLLLTTFSYADVITESLTVRQYAFDFFITSPITTYTSAIVTNYPNGSRMCRNAVLNITPSVVVAYSIPAATNADLRCPDVSCTLDGSAAPILIANSVWFNNTAYAGVSSRIYPSGLVVATQCRASSVSNFNFAGFNFLNINARHFYVPGDPAGGITGRGNVSLYCKGSFNASIDGGTGNITDASSSMTYNATFATNGFHYANVSTIVENCSMLTASYTASSPSFLYTCIYSNSTFSQRVLNDSFELTVIGIPDLTVASFTLPGSAQENALISWSITLNNIGDNYANITGVTLTNLNNVAVATSLPLILNASNSTTISGTARAPSNGTYNVTAQVTYIGDQTAVGPCSVPATVNLSMGTLTVQPPIPPGPIPPVSVRLRVTPSAIILKDGKFLVGNNEIFHINVNGTIKRSWPDGNDRVDVDTGNVTIQRFDIGAGIWRTVTLSVYNPNYFPNQPARYCDPYATGCNEYGSGMGYEVKTTENTTSVITLRQPINYPPQFSWCGGSYVCSSPWQTGVYSVTADVWDPRNLSVQSARAYFVIFNLNCKDFA